MEPTYIPLEALHDHAAAEAEKLEITGALPLRSAAREVHRAVKTLRTSEAGVRAGRRGAASPAGE